MRAEEEEETEGPIPSTHRENIYNMQNKLWKQRNLDCHKPKNKSNYAAVIKTD